MKKRFLIIFSGLVQGVGFRGTVCYLINQIGELTGYVKNMRNGDTMVEIQGEKEKIDDFLGRCLENPGLIKIFDYSLKELPLIPEEKEFTIRF